MTCSPQAARAIAVCQNRASSTGWVYFMTDGVAMKIGYSVVPESRRTELQTSHYAELKVIARFRGTLLDEKAIHRRLGHARIRGEWFKMAEAERMMAELQAGDADIRDGYTTLADFLGRRKPIVREPTMRANPTAEKLRAEKEANRDVWPDRLKAAATRAICSLEYEHRNAKHGISEKIHAMNMADLKEFENEYIACTMDHRQ